MAQNTWDLPDATDDFIDARTAYNNAINNLATNHAGNSAPAVIHDRMWWYDEDDDILKLEDGAGGWLEVLLGEADGGMLRIDGSNAMTGDLDLNGVSELVLDADADTKIAATTDDQIDFTVAGAIDMELTANQLDFKSTKLKDPSYNTTASVGSIVGQIIVDINGTDRAIAYYATS